MASRHLSRSTPIRRALPFLIALLAAISFTSWPTLVFGEEPAACVPAARLTKIADKYVYEVSATTDLPDETVCDLAVIYLKHLPPIPNLPPEESKEYELEEIVVETGTARVACGKFEQTLGYNVRAPYAGDYRLRVGIAKAAQPDALAPFLAAHPAPEAGWNADFAVGTAAELASQKMAVQKQVQADFVAVYTAWRDLTTQFRREWPLESPNLEAWDTWAKSWNEGLTEVERRNGERLEAEIYWVESGGKRYIRYLIRELRVMLRDFRAAIAQNPKTREPYEGYLEQAASYEALLNRYLQNLGFGTMMDKTKVAAACDGLAAALDDASRRVVALSEPDAALSEAIAADRAAALDHLFTLGQEANEYGYATLMDLAGAVPAAFSACEAAIAPGATAEAQAAAAPACERALKALSGLRAALGVDHPPK